MNFTFPSIFKTGSQKRLTTPKHESHTFHLKYKSLFIATLKLENGIWSFNYSEAFKAQDVIKPLHDFPNVDKVYKSEELYPFFLHRIPSPKQSKVQKAIKENNIDATNEAALLKFFGFQSISNPFLLLAA